MMTTSYTDIQRLFEQRKNNPLFNTSYPLSPGDWAKYSTSGTLSFDASKPIAFYLHIPFCRQICSFCEYTKMCVPDTEKQRNYISTLIRDIERFVEKYPEWKFYGFDIGGGTPTALDSEVFSELMIWYKHFIGERTVTDRFEPSIEGTFDSMVSDYQGYHKSRLIAKAGIKRLSLGIQSTSNIVLKPLHRNPISCKEMAEAIEEWHRLGISKINLDLMYGLPGQTVENIRKDIEVIRMLNPEQVTVYEFRTNQLYAPYKTDNDTCFTQYCELYEGLIRLGYYGEFGRNTFSRDAHDMGLSSYLRHRMFDGWQYKGFGISAQSMSEYGVSYNMGKNESIGKLIDNHSYESIAYYNLPSNELLNKFIAISGYSGGFSLSVAKGLFGEDFATRYNHILHFLIDEKLATISGDRLQLAKIGFRHYGAILSLFYSLGTV